jgi:hypothetical protein
MTTAVPNAAPWVNRILKDNWARLAARVPPKLLPRAMAFGKSFHVEDYGCGHYGCVAPTATPGTVFKLTTDGAEASFVAHALKIGRFPEGIVHYQKIYKVPDASFRKRDVYMLWREEAYNLGELGDREALSRLDAFKTWAHDARERLRKSANPTKTLVEVKGLERWAYDQVSWEEAELRRKYESQSRPSGLRAAYAIAWDLRACELVAEMMANEPGAYLIGQAFEFYAEHGILLADVHRNNVGKVSREDYNSKVWAITDPGHMMPLTPERMDFHVEEL